MRKAQPVGFNIGPFFILEGSPNSTIMPFILGTLQQSITLGASDFDYQPMVVSPSDVTDQWIIR